jgi:hypothetical protein
MEELADPPIRSASTATNSIVGAFKRVDALTSRSHGCTSVLGSALAFRCVVLKTVSLLWIELARRTWHEVIDDDV